jgi:hypothetical protein
VLWRLNGEAKSFEKIVTCSSILLASMPRLAKFSSLILIEENSTFSLKNAATQSRRFQQHFWREKSEDKLNSELKTL